MEWISEKRFGLDIYSPNLISVNLMDFRSWQDIPRKKQGLIFVISYYRITITSEQRYLQGITVFYALDCNRLFSIIKSLKIERWTQYIVSALFISIEG